MSSLHKALGLEPYTATDDIEAIKYYSERSRSELRRAYVEAKDCGDERRLRLLQQIFDDRDARGLSAEPPAYLREEAEGIRSDLADVSITGLRRKYLERRLTALVAVEATLPPAEPADAAPTSKAETDASKVSKCRAECVAKLIRELDVLKPQISTEEDSEYVGLQKEHPDFLTFEIAEQRPGLKLKVRSIRGSRRHIRLAQELAAAFFRKALSTIKDDWKHHKPAEFRRQS